MAERKVCIVQAYEASTTPAWIAQCLRSVEEWAAMRGYDYQFSPVFWSYVPEWFRERCGSELGPLTDVGRMYLLKKQFECGADYVIWVDADVVVFDPSNFIIDTSVDFFGIEEITILTFPDKKITVSSPGLNGAVLGASHGSEQFDMYLNAIEAVVRDYPNQKIPRTIAGPQLLTQLAATNRIASLTNVGLFTPAILNEIAQGKTELSAIFSRSFGHKVAAANLCHFIRETLTEESILIYDEVMQVAINRLVASRGSIVNKYLDAPNNISLSA
jgi:hypothetical protein